MSEPQSTPTSSKKADLSEVMQALDPNKPENRLPLEKLSGGCHNEVQVYQAPLVSFIEGFRFD